MDNYTREADADGEETSPSASDWGWGEGRLVFVLASARRHVVDVLEGDSCAGVAGWCVGGRKIAPRLPA